MRSEEQILGLIVNTARSDDRIRAAILSGSRANPDARRDTFQDFDVAYFVTDVDSFRNDPAWIRRFGEIMIVQMPEAMEDPPGRNDGRFVYLMQFTDGNRIDLTLLPAGRLDQRGEEIRGVVLLDKDRVLGSNPVPGESDRLPVPPTASAFSDCCNEFWWVCTYVAKGLWRREIIYAKFMLDQVVRAQLMKMLTWHVGVRTEFSKGPGHFGRNLEQHLEPELWAMLEKTYSDAGYENTWNALYAMCDLFRVTADHVAAYCGLDYPRSDDENVTAHLTHVRFLPGPKKLSAPRL
jgi:aminoglycoside 6-adenylyltransferase